MSSHAARNGRPLPGTPQSDSIPWSLKKDQGWYEGKQAEENLRHSEELYRLVVTAMAEGVLLRDAEGKILACNQSFERLVGMTKEQLAGTTAATWEHLTIHEDGARFPGTTQPSEVALRTGKPQSNVRMGFRKPDGSLSWASINAQPMMRSGESKPYAVLTTFTDITEQKQSHEALQRREAELREAQRVARMGGWRVDIASGEVTWSEELYRMIGQDSGHRVSSFGGMQRFLTKDGWDALQKAYHQVLDTGEPGHGVEVEFRRSDGATGWVILRGDLDCDASGQVIGMHGGALDITDRKRTEQALRESEERLRMAQSVAKMGVFERNFLTGASRWAPEMEEMYGLPTGGFPNTVEGFLGLVHPEDRPQVARLVEESFRSGEGHGEWRVTWPDGSVHWIAGRWRVFLDQEGRPARMIGIDHEITDRKQAEEALRTSEREQHRIAEQLETERARLIEAQAVAKVGSWETELPSLDTTWSEQTHRIFETDPSCFHPTRPGFVELVHPEDRAKVDAAFGASLEKGAPSTVEYRIVMADGRVKVLEERWKVFHDGQGRPARLTGTCQDITERKRTEASLREALEEARLAKEKLAEENFYLEQEIDTELGFEEIVGRSPALKAAMENVAKVAGSTATVLLLGETGVGKELVARALHRLSSRRGNSFIKVNCAAIPTGLLESELFGHEKGAFTGAVNRKIGRLELADKGTLFLDEIGEIPLMLQPKLLRVLQDMEFERLGATKTLKVDFRLIAATNRDLPKSVHEHEFRSDLYYRLNVFPIRVPPLRERREDIRPLAEHFVHKFARKMGKSITSIPKKTIDTLAQWDWPGNVRELENFIERSVILTRGSLLAAPLGELSTPRENSGNGNGNGTLQEAEREHVLRALRESRGRISGPYGAAERLGLKRTTLQSKLKEMGIDRRRIVDEN
jgi:PAS domain S-box-containing protein